jgi:hypothetical protein
MGNLAQLYRSFLNQLREVIRETPAEPHVIVFSIESK